MMLKPRISTMAPALQFLSAGELIMRYQMIFVAILAVAQSAAQEPQRYNGNYYGFVSMGRCNHGYGQFGGGGGAEALLWKGITVGVDGSYQQFTDGWGYGMVSPQFGYHFVDRNKRAQWDPFITMGAGWAVAGGVGGSANLGGGVTYWFNRKVGVRLEYRGHVVAYEEAVGTFRMGVTFR